MFVMVEAYQKVSWAKDGTLVYFYFYINDETELGIMQINTIKVDEKDNVKQDAQLYLTTASNIHEIAAVDCNCGRKFFFCRYDNEVEKNVLLRIHCKNYCYAHIPLHDLTKFYEEKEEEKIERVKSLENYLKLFVCVKKNEYEPDDTKNVVTSISYLINEEFNLGLISVTFTDGKVFHYSTSLSCVLEAKDVRCKCKAKVFDTLNKESLEINVLKHIHCERECYRRIPFEDYGMKNKKSLDSLKASI